jgi:signal transduction histidine kinase
MGVLRGDRDRFTLDCRCCSNDEARCFLMNATPLRAGSAGVVVSYVDITELKRAQEMRDRAGAQLKALANKHLAIQEEERRMLSMELHDQVGQMLTGLKLDLDAIRRKTAEAPAVQALVAQADEMVDSLLGTTRDLSRRLRPPMLDDLGLASAVRWHMSKLAMPGHVDISLYENLGAERFPAEVELACFRIVQEAVSNAIRHARAGEIAVSLRRRAGALQLSIRDNGVGFDVDEIFRSSQDMASLGLIGMRERISGLDGQFRLDSSLGAGTEVSATFRLPQLP